MKHVLGRDTPNWRLKNACPACMYKLEGEPPLVLPLLTTMDGNNSLKRFHRRERTEEGSAGASKEREDSRQVPGDYYLSPEEVNEWGKEELEELLKGFTPDPVRFTGRESHLILTHLLGLGRRRRRMLRSMGEHEGARHGQGVGDVRRDGRLPVPVPPWLCVAHCRYDPQRRVVGVPFCFMPAGSEVFPERNMATLWSIE